MKELQELGWESFGLSVMPNSSHILEYGSPAGIAFLSKGEFCYKFLSELNVEKLENSSKVLISSLSEQVQEKLNEAYQRDIKTKNRVEWKKIREGSIAMEGFPQGIVPAPASHFGVPKLRRILNNLKHVTFREMVQHEEEDEQQEIDQEDQQDRRTEEEQVAFSQVEEEYGVNENNHPFENEAEAVEATLPSSESTINNNDIYAVECILDKKKRKNKPYYLVQWKGYLQSTWEPQENIHLYIKRAFDAKKTAS